MLLTRCASVCVAQALAAGSCLSREASPDSNHTPGRFGLFSCIANLIEYNIIKPALGYAAQEAPPNESHL